eukprot:TRINITY_DN7442_c0_g1_i1.p1 TRINITY_DN7442_c0_g1~~TRINITY_DN7442_c0_g1_i1.p1  ORF type:complete len:374 (+),score=58.79 TRINITY_DN7442_c0_g1_i1:3-1124(+)
MTFQSNPQYPNHFKNMDSNNIQLENPPSLQNVLDQKELKWVFVGGKGGVGKTTCSCSLAVQLSQVKRSVLVISTDPAHNLSDAFDQKFTKNPTLVNGFSNLYAMEVEPKVEMSELDMLGGSSGEGMQKFVNELANSIPGIDEAMSFGEVIRQVKSLDYETIVFDTAPTGHTLRLLQFPETLQKALGKLSGMKDQMGGLLSGILGMGGGNENGLDSMLGKVEELQTVVSEVNKQFKDPERTTFVCVCIPEFLSLYETERLVQELYRFEMDVRNIIINQILYDDGGHSRLLKARIAMQQKYLEQFHDLYDEDFHLITLPLLEKEVRGTEAVKAFSKNLIVPYQPPKPLPDDKDEMIKELQRQNEELKKQIQKLTG